MNKIFSLSISKLQRHIRCFCDNALTAGVYDSNHFESAERSYARQIMKSRKECVLFDLESKSKPMQYDFNRLGTAAWKKKSEFEADKLIQKLSQRARHRASAREIPQCNKICLNEFRQWPIRKRLHVLDIYYFIGDSAKTDFVKEAINESLAQFDTLHVDQAMQIMYYMTWSRRKLNQDEAARVENVLVKVAAEAPLEVLSVWNMGIYRTETELSNELIKTMYQRLIDGDIGELPDVGLNLFIKV